MSYRAVDLDEWGISFEHVFDGFKAECELCGADLSSWLDDEDDFEGGE